MQSGDRTLLRLLHAFSLAKSENSANEDCWAVALGDFACALSDGASVSYDPAQWAQILVRRFVENPEVTEAWIQEACDEYHRRYDRAAMPWMHQAAFDQGTYATLLGLAYSDENNSAKIFSVGDSLIALLEGNNLVLTCPYTRAEQFDEPPILFSTNLIENWSFADWAFVTTIDLSERANFAILLMSDALGRWLLSNEPLERATKLLSIKDEDMFRCLVEAQRSSGELRKDDTTLLILASQHEPPTDH